jgi:hypothetical protein
VRGGNAAGHVGLVGDVGMQVAGVGRTEQGDGGRTLGVVDVEQRDLAAVGDDAPGHGQAEAGNPPVTSAHMESACMKASFGPEQAGILADGGSASGQHRRSSRCYN